MAAPVYGVVFNLPHKTITQIDDSKPFARPELWNNRYLEQERNFRAIESAISALVSKAVQFDAETGGAYLPIGNTVEAGAADMGKLRFNSDTGALEFANGYYWTRLATSDAMTNVVIYDNTQGSAQMPTGNTEQAGVPFEGRLRFNLENNAFEYGDGAKWQELPSVDSVNSAIAQGLAQSDLANAVLFDAATGGALLPVGTTAQAGTATAGKLRYNSEKAAFEYADGASWNVLGKAGSVPSYDGTNPQAPTAGAMRYNLQTGLVEFGDGSQWAPIAPTQAVLFDTAKGGALIPVGTTAQAGAPAMGKLRFNSEKGIFEYGDGSAWQDLGQGIGTGGGSGSGTGTGTGELPLYDGEDPQAPTAGKMRFNLQTGLVEFADGTSWRVLDGADGGSSGPTEPSNAVLFDAATGGALMPVGTTAQAGATTAGKLRYNSEKTVFEYADGGQWVELASVAAVSGLVQAAMGSNLEILARAVLFDTATGGAQLPAGTTAQAGAHAMGKLRYNTGSNALEYSNGTTWSTLASTPAMTTAITVALAKAVALDGGTMTGGALMPVGTTSQAGTPTLGKLRYNTNKLAFEYGDGTDWKDLVSTNAAPTGSFVSYDTATGGALLPTGDTTNRGAATAGKLRYNTQTKLLEVADGQAWGSLKPNDWINTPSGGYVYSCACEVKQDTTTLTAGTFLMVPLESAALLQPMVYTVRGQLSTATVTSYPLVNGQIITSRSVYLVQSSDDTYALVFAANNADIYAKLPNAIRYAKVTTLPLTYKDSATYTLNGAFKVIDRNTYYWQYDYSGAGLQTHMPLLATGIKGALTDGAISSTVLLNFTRPSYVDSTYFHFRIILAPGSGDCSVGVWHPDEVVYSLETAMEYITAQTIGANGAVFKDISLPLSSNSFRVYMNSTRAKIYYRGWGY